MAHNIIGHCYYLEDGVEVQNTMEYNLASLIHSIGVPPASGDASGQYMPTYSVSSTLLIPADLTASGYYVTNANNIFVGNVASGGWSGFSFINLPTPTGVSRTAYPSYVPLNQNTLVFEGNVAHSSGYWWTSAACIYVGGWLAYDPFNTTLLTYNPGRSNDRSGLVQLNNTRVYACNVGILNWGYLPDIRNYEAHDVTRAATIFGSAIISSALFNCRTSNMAPRVSTGTSW